jgi:hypothetical protein
MTLLKLKGAIMTDQQLLILDSVSEGIREEFEERAAIFEYDANMTREEAEQRAFYLVMSAHIND